MTFTLQAAADALERRLRAHRLLDLPVPWADEVIFPDYGGLSIYNVAHTVARLLGADLPDSAPLDDAVWGGDPPEGTVDRVVLILSDGLGYRWLGGYMAGDDDLRAAVYDLTDGRGPLPLTATCPSTTATALTTLWTGASPARHGLMSFRVYLREISTLAIPLFWQPVAGNHPRGSLSQYGLDPAAFVPVPGLVERLAAAGVPTYVFLRHDFLNSGFSLILHRGLTEAGARPHMNSSDIWPRLRELLAETAGQRCYIAVYWDQVDTLSHAYGSGNAYIHHEVRRQLADLRAVLADDSVRDGRTLVLLLADHGHANTPHVLNVRAEPRAAPIYDALHGFMSGEGRLPYLHLRAGFRQAVIDCLEAAFADCLAWIDPAAALEAGLFGPGPSYAEVPHRLGDLILVPRLGWKLDDGSGPPGQMMSSHGGLSDWEMLVPLLWKRL